MSDVPGAPAAVPSPPLHRALAVGEQLSSQQELLNGPGLQLSPPGEGNPSMGPRQPQDLSKPLLGTPLLGSARGPEASGSDHTVSLGCLDLVRWDLGLLLSSLNLDSACNFLLE